MVKPVDATAALAAEATSLPLVSYFVTLKAIAVVVDGELGDFVGRDLVVDGFLDFFLGYVIVLAEAASEVATGGGDAKDGCAGKHVVNRLLLDGVNLQRAGQIVNEGEEFAGEVHPVAAVAAFAFLDYALSEAKPAPDLPPFQFDVVHGFLAGDLPARGSENYGALRGGVARRHDDAARSECGDGFPEKTPSCLFFPHGVASPQ